MSTIFMSPEWFFGYDIIFQLFAFVISLVISLYALKVYRTTGQQLARYFGYGFLLISIAYLVQSISNFLQFSHAAMSVLHIMDLSQVSLSEALGIYAYMLFMISGIVLLLFVSLKSDKKRTLFILWLISVLAIILSSNRIYTFYLLCTIYLGFIAWHFVENYLNNKQWTTLTVALAFVFLGFGTFHFLISVNHDLFYAIGHGLEFLAYILILINWYLVKK